VHRLLTRQLRQLGLDEGTLPSLENWKELIGSVRRAYEAVDRERYMVEHSIQLASQEMEALNTKLSREHDKLASIFRAAPTGMAIIDREGRIMDFNRALQETVGYLQNEAVGRYFWEFLSPEEIAAGQKKFRELVTEGRPSGRTEYRLTAKDGRVVLASVGLTPVYDDAGALELVIAGIEDVTEKTRLEVELRHSQKLESVGRLAAGIAHEINTPIQFVGDNVNFLATAFEQILSLCDCYRKVCEIPAGACFSTEDLAEVKKAEELADFEYIRANVSTSIASTIDGVGRVSKIVQSMKAFAHPDRGERSSADLNGALRNTLTVATNELKYVAMVETDFGDIPAVPCFLSDLNQVFLNLLVNAAHAIGDSVGKSGRRGVIRVRTYQEGSVVVIAISDTGTGIPEAVRGRIFDPFFTTKEVGRGTGQGLALARSVVVEKHGGSLNFETEMGKGTTFFIRIPFGLDEVT
jgi:PAS domain S-box-containing protein